MVATRRQERYGALNDGQDGHCAGGLSLTPAFRPAPRLLQIAQKFSAVPRSGAELRIFHLATQLARHMPVTHLGFAAPDHASAPVPGVCPVEFVAVPRQGTHRIVDLVRGVVGRTPFPILNYTRASMRCALRQRLAAGHFDIALLESVHLGAYLADLRSASCAPSLIACDWHNIESEVLSRYADAGIRLFRRLYGRQTVHRLKSYEQWFVNRCDLHITVSERDREALIGYGCRAPIVVIDNGVDVAHYSAGQRGRSSGSPGRPLRRILYVGSMDAFENIDAVTFFCSRIWPRIRRALPETVFTIVGRNPSKEVRALAAMERVQVTGSVDDVRPYYADAFAAIAPIRVAGGSRLKILEAMAAGVVVVSTRRGAEGLALTPGVHYLSADTEAEMEAALLHLAHDEGKRESLAAAGGALVRERYDWPVLGDRLAAALSALLGNTTPAGATRG